MKRSSGPVRHKHIRCTARNCTQRAVFAFHHDTPKGQRRVNYRCEQHLEGYIRYASKVLGETMKDATLVTNGIDWGDER